MTTQQETMRRFLNLLEDVEGKEKVDPEITKFNKEILSIAGSLEESLRPIEQLDEVNLKKLAASLAVVAATMTAGLAHAADPAGLIDQSSHGATAASCTAILQGAAKAPGLDDNVRTILINGANKWDNITAKFATLAKQRGDQAELTRIRNAFNRVDSAAAKATRDGYTTSTYQPILEPSKDCLLAAAQIK